MKVKPVSYYCPHCGERYCIVGDPWLYLPLECSGCGKEVMEYKKKEEK